MKKIEIENGYYYFKLEDILKRKNISINSIIIATDTDFKVIKRLMTGNLVRIDLIVLARLCDYLNCEMKDIIEYKGKFVEK